MERELLDGQTAGTGVQRAKWATGGLHPTSASGGKDGRIRLGRSQAHHRRGRRHLPAWGICGKQQPILLCAALSETNAVRSDGHTPTVSGNVWRSTGRDRLRQHENRGEQFTDKDDPSQLFRLLEPLWIPSPAVPSTQAERERNGRKRDRTDSSRGVQSEESVRKLRRGERIS
ncbi:MAG: hypothetical protein BWX67_02307 [Thermotogae bacterium ADurb.Bin062]|nr:MAG: hypothetical protein BWX67_02307 [Thermotogota bacterium ADurb.Bin062]